jgi:predicted lipoprotein with Yx(FWY)xxD motif
MTTATRRTKTSGTTTAKRARGTALVAVGAAGLLLLAACGSSSGDTASRATKSSASGGKAAAQPGKVATTSTSLGKVLVDPRGMTLYAFAADSPHRSVCTGSCLGYWPPAPGADATKVAASGVTAKLATIKRSDGTSQLTANGYPVYTYVGDSASGQTNGQGKNISGGLWWVVSPSGTWIKKAAPSSGSGTRGGY